MGEIAAQPDAFEHRSDIFQRISAHLARETEIRAALAAVAGEFREVLPFTHVDICLLDGGDSLVSYEVGIQTRWSRRRTHRPVSPIRDLLSGKLDHMICSNAMEDPRQTFPGAASEPIFNHNLRSRVHVCMKVMGQLIGTLNISHDEIGFYDTRSLQLAQHLADLLAPYFHALRSIEKAQADALARAEVQSREEGLRQGALQLTEALERERQRIGMDLHDQTLADLTRLLRLVTNEDEEQADARALADGLGMCIRDLRRIIEEAVPAQLELFGFCHAISEHLERGRGAETVETHVEDHTAGSVDQIRPTVRTALFRITQEATNNALRHSRATRIDVCVDRDLAGALRITVRDDGCGVSSNSGARRSGLLHMETRARLISARLSITEDSGTQVVVTLPEAGPAS